MGLLTFGHGRLDSRELTELLNAAEITRIVDVRRFPGSRANPAAARGEIQRLANDVGIAYRWDERLGGRRHLTAARTAKSPDTWWRVDAFRAYAAWTRGAEFLAAMAELRAETAEAATAVMCAETPWWRCHRRLIADVAQLAHRMPVRHLMPGRRPMPHPVAAGARLAGEGQLVWDGQDDPP